MKRVILLTLLTSLLTGCVAMVVAGAATTGIVVYDRRPVVMLERDARIFYTVRHEIQTDPRLKGSHISVNAFNQAVLLVGQTPAASSRVLAEKIAQSTPEVHRVYNRITLGSGRLLAERSEDAWITTEVRAKLLTKRGLASGSIRVVTENHVVYLMGIVTEEQAYLALDVARHVKGVRQVVKIFQYQSV